MNASLRPPSLLQARALRAGPAAIVPSAPALAIPASRRRRLGPVGTAPASAAPRRHASSGGVLVVGGDRRVGAFVAAAALSSGSSSSFRPLRVGPASTAAAAAGPSAAATAGRRIQNRSSSHPRSRRRPLPSPPRSAATTDVVEQLAPLGYDFLTFFATTVLMVPAFKALRVSPVLGYLGAGLVLKQLGLLQDLRDVQLVSELGVLFLLFEMGLELSLDRLRALARFAFGMGTLQMVACTALFTAFALPAGSSFGTWFLEVVAGAPPSLVSIRSVDEAVVIGAALSLSSSAFVLQLLKERGELATRFGSATLGILLLQDIAVVPFLVLLPVIEERGGMEGMGGMAAGPLLQELGPTLLKTLAGLGLLLLGGRFGLRRVFDFVAKSRSPETFVALCLLTVTGASMLTQRMGLSDTLGAFIAGVLLAETSYRAQVEADIKPFRALLLGLFFVSVGSSINVDVLKANWDVAAWMLAGLVSLKATVITTLGPAFGLSRSEAVRTGLLLSQGGEFAFVLLSLACRLKLLPNDLNQILIVTVVLSMVITPALAEAGKWLGDRIEEDRSRPALEGAGSAGGGVDGPGAGGSSQQQGQQQDAYPSSAWPFDDNNAPLVPALLDPPAVVILGFGAQGQMVANMLSSPLVYERLAPSTAPGAFALATVAAAGAGAAVAGGGGMMMSGEEDAAVAEAAMSSAAQLAAVAAAASGAIDVEAEAAESVVALGPPAAAAAAAAAARAAATAGGATSSAGTVAQPPPPYAAFDLDPARVRAAQRAGFRVFYGDATRPSVLRAAGIDRPPRAFVVCYGGEGGGSSSAAALMGGVDGNGAGADNFPASSSDEAAAAATDRAVRAVRALNDAFPGVPAYAVASDFLAAAALRSAGAHRVCIAGSEAGVNLGSTVCLDLGASESDVGLMRRDIDEALVLRTDALVRQLAGDRKLREAAAAAAEQKQLQQPAAAAAQNGNGTALDKPQQQQPQPMRSVEMFVLDRAQALTRATTAAVADGLGVPAAAAFAASAAAAAGGAGGSSAGGVQAAVRVLPRKPPVSDSLQTGVPMASVDEYIPSAQIAPPSPPSSAESSGEEEDGSHT